MIKILKVLTISLLLINCGGDDTPIIEKEIIEKPVVEKPKEGEETSTETVTATDDTFDAIEDESKIIPSFLANDTYTSENVTVTIDSESKNKGTVKKIGSDYVYTSAKNFVGTDSFNYTICSTTTTDICATAIVTVNVADQGNPVAVDDTYTTKANTVIEISDYLDNDTIIDNAKIDKIDISSTTGSAVLNANGTISYTPKTDFSGNDTFTYTICDNDAIKSCETATITITVSKETSTSTGGGVSFNLPTDLTTYYAGLVFTNDASNNYEILKQLTVQSHSTILSYSGRHDYLYDADADINNPANVVLIYTGVSNDRKEYMSGLNSHGTQTFNTEHVYPKSRLSNSTAKTDLHHLRTCNGTINSKRSNLPFTEGSGSYKKTNGAWYPGDEWKGDVARMIFYLNVRYGESFENVGSKELFLKWNKEDPVSEFEKQRNNVIETAQGNRNPFIDNPYLATLTWGGSDAENTWK